MNSTDSTVKKLVQIAESVAQDECEAVQHGQEPCPMQYDDAEQWCLSCQARKAIEQYLNAYAALS